MMEGMSLGKEGYVGSTNIEDVSQVICTSHTCQGNKEVISWEEENKSRDTLGDYIRRQEVKREDLACSGLAEENGPRFNYDHKEIRNVQANWGRVYQRNKPLSTSIPLPYSLKLLLS
jgi:hypothetical protein